MLFGRQRTGSTLCPSCGKLVGVNDEVCWSCGRKNPGMWGLTSVFRRLGHDLGFMQAVIGGSVFLYLAMLAVDPAGIRMGGLFDLAAPSQEAILRFGASGAGPVFGLDRWWTVLSAGWLHASLLHIGFNVYWIRFLAPATAELYGAARMVIIYTISSIVGFTASSVAQLYLPLGLVTVGASAPILGLLGAMVYYGRRTGSSSVGRTAWSYALFMIIFGFLMSRVDNAAHLGGFAGGYLVSMALNPMKPERGDHILIALVCLVASLASIIASVVTVLRP